MTSAINDASLSSGAVYVFRREANAWVQESYLKASNSNANDKFGSSVSLSGDTLAVGAPDEASNQITITNGGGSSTDNSVASSGAVYVYQRVSNAWSQQAYIKASNANLQDRFGDSVALSGHLLVVGASRESSNQTTVVNGPTGPSDNSLPQSGAAYVYRRSGVTWVQEAFLKASNAGSSDWFGSGLSVYGDSIAVGAINESSSQTTITNGTSASTDDSLVYSGALYVFRRTSGAWSQEAFIKAYNARSGLSFGSALSLTGDSLAVGAAFDGSGETTILNSTWASGDTTSLDSGAVFVYRRIGTYWAQEAYIKASNNGLGDKFGSSVDISGDTLVVGAPFEDSAQSTVTNGASADSLDSKADAGAVYVFHRAGSLWSPAAYLKAPNPDVADGFGTQVSLSGDTLAVGAPNEDENSSVIVNGAVVPNANGASSSGAVYIYRSPSRLFDPDVRVFDVTSSSVIFKWSPNLGKAGAHIIVAPVAVGDASPVHCGLSGAGGSITLAQGVFDYTYFGLNPSTRYGFRFCSTDGTEVLSGTTIWVRTAP